MGELITNPENLDWKKMNNLIPAVAQDYKSGDVLMLAYMNPESLQQTIETGLATYWSRRNGLWVKGETSGNIQLIKAIRVDCDEDALLLEIDPKGPACHKKDDAGNYRKTCFYRRLGGEII